MLDTSGWRGILRFGAMVPVPTERNAGDMELDAEELGHPSQYDHAKRRVRLKLKIARMIRLHVLFPFGLVNEQKPRQSRTNGVRH